jgi:hypothetical protein
MVLWKIQHEKFIKRLFAKVRKYSDREVGLRKY